MVLPLPRSDRLKSACALLAAGDARGTGFLVSPDYLLTCHHVVRDAIQSPICVYFSHGQAVASVELIDEANDCALLRLARPIAPDRAIPLPLAVGTSIKGIAWEGYGFPAVTGQAGLLMDGQVQDPSGQDPSLREAIVLRSANITAGSWLSGFSGSPVLVDGLVIGQMRQIIPDAAGGAQMAILYACPAAVLTSLVRKRIDLTASVPRWTSRPASAASSSLFCVPMLHPQFTGRDDVLVRLQQALTERPVVALWGLGGMGKTQTAVALAHRYAAENPRHAVLWMNCDSASQFLQCLFELARPLSVSGRLRRPYDDRDPATLRQSVIEYLEQGEDYLLICDNADSPQELKDVWPRRFRGKVLITSRSQDVRRLGAVVIELGKLAEHEALAYLSSCHPPQSPDEQRSLAALAREFDGLPLALAQAAAFLVEHQSRYADYLRQYRKQRLGLLEQGLPIDYPRSVATTWAMSVAEVERAAPQSMELLKLCAMLDPDALPEELLAESIPREDDELALDRQLKPLLNHAFLQRDRQSRLLSMHRLVQHALRRQMDRTEQERLIRAIAAYLDVLFPYVQYENWPLCRRLLPHVVQLCEHIERFSLFEITAARPIEQAVYFLAEQNEDDAAEKMLRRALLIREKTLGDQHPSYAGSLNSLGRFLRERSRLDEAEPICQKAVAIWESALGPEHPNLAFGLTNLGKIMEARHNYDDAEVLLRRALRIRESMHPRDAVTISYSLHNLGLLLFAQGKHSEAEALLRQTVAIREKSMNPGSPELAQALRSLGILLQSSAQPQEAEQCLRHALRIYEQAFPESHPQLQATRRAVEKLTNKSC